MTSRYVRPDVKAQHHDYEDADCPFHAGNLSIIWERLFSESRSGLASVVSVIGDFQHLAWFRLRIASIPMISQPVSSEGTMLSRPPRTVRLTNLFQSVPTPSMLGHSGQAIPETMKYGAVWDGHHRQYLTAPPMNPMTTNKKLRRIALPTFIGGSSKCFLVVERSLGRALQMMTVEIRP